MATKKATKKVEAPVIDEVVEMAPLPGQTSIEEVIEAPVEVKVLSRYRVEGVAGDAHIFERIKLDDSYAGEKGVQKFVGVNGSVIYYTEKLVKRYSDNVVTS